MWHPRIQELQQEMKSFWMLEDLQKWCTQATAMWNVASWMSQATSVSSTGLPQASLRSHGELSFYLLFHLEDAHLLWQWDLKFFLEEPTCAVVCLCYLISVGAGPWLWLSCFGKCLDLWWEWASNHTRLWQTNLVFVLTWSVWLSMAAWWVKLSFPKGYPPQANPTASANGACKVVRLHKGKVYSAQQN